MAVVTFVVGLARGEAPGDMFLAAVALAVGAIPEVLPAAVTIALAIGVARMLQWLEDLELSLKGQGDRRQDPAPLF